MSRYAHFRIHCVFTKAARKAHTCIVCETPIPVGSSYHSVYVQNGLKYGPRMKMHIDCIKNESPGGRFEELNKITTARRIQASFVRKEFQHRSLKDILARMDEAPLDDGP